MLKFGGSAVITDAKALFDSTTSVTSGLKLSERRTAIEICILRERLAASGSTVRWCNSLQQLADGLTKGSSKDTLAHVLSRGVHSLRFDPGFVAAKKVSKADRIIEEKELEKAAENLFDGQNCFAEDPREKERDGLCRLPGCKKKKEEGNDKNAYCSRRHYYLHQFRKTMVETNGRRQPFVHSPSSHVRTSLELKRPTKMRVMTTAFTIQCW